MNSKVLTVFVGRFVATTRLLVACGGGSSGSTTAGTTSSAATSTSGAHGRIIVNGRETGSGAAVSDRGAGGARTPAGFFTAITVHSSVVAIVGTAGAATGTIGAARATVMTSSCPWASGSF